MEKIFENFSKIKVRDFISLEQEIGCLKIDDTLFAKSLESGKDETKNLSFIGINAPAISEQRIDNMFEYSSETLNGVMRGLFVQANHTKKFE